jgi:hypothetical protein
MSRFECDESPGPLMEPDPDHIETVHEAWTSYMAAAYPHGMGVLARRELRRAFYMGAWSMLSNVAVASQIEAPGGSAVMKNLWDEISAFVDKVQAHQD